ncbi:hypothetical protein CGGC5_v011018 [Colletotrichum fructicola Nara gc5]|uniref:Uncharacterized protein n=1 Tax=Colletotrichum fructicola (strain Nara gc5) TaxID=1213859 RepID=A0A7J6IY29_COLFN|nr:hypothetical protein CFRS1_v015351 [Colletotrichum fructicola]KAF4481122.1 hypothetical protein CGGC5_v011018 [Colletotrichum fructicola Nara gc5]KAF4894902.1 hypothetical protein CGCFRS4_v006228 [Colletotrichum fructicola]
MVVQPEQGENECDTSRPGSEFNVSYQDSLNVRNEGSLGYHSLHTDTRGIIASQLAAGNHQLPHGPGIDASRHEVDTNPRADCNSVAERVDSDESDDEEDPFISAPVNSVSQVDLIDPQHDELQRVYRATAKDVIHALSHPEFETESEGTLTVPVINGVSPFIMFPISGKAAMYLTQSKKRLM